MYDPAESKLIKRKGNKTRLRKKDIKKNYRKAKVLSLAKNKYSMTSSINDGDGDGGVHHEHALPPLTILLNTFVPNHRNLDHSIFTLHL